MKRRMRKRGCYLMKHVCCELSSQFSAVSRQVGRYELEDEEES